MAHKTQWTVRAVVDGATAEEISGEGKANKLPALRDMASRNPLGCELWMTESGAKAWAVFRNDARELVRVRGETKA